jgi:hypothetical protein
LSIQILASEHSSAIQSFFGQIGVCYMQNLGGLLFQKIVGVIILLTFKESLGNCQSQPHYPPLAAKPRGAAELVQPWDRQFVGSSLLLELLQSTNDQILCLDRSTNNSAQDRLRLLIKNLISP